MATPQEMEQFNALMQMDTGTYKGSGDVIDFSLYDTAELAAATTEYRMFQVPRGQGGKGLQDTNMQAGGQLPVGQKLYVKAIKVQYLADAALDAAHKLALNTFLFNASLNFFIEGKDTYGRWPLAEIFGVPMLADQTTATVDAISTGRFVGILPLNLPIILASQVSFSVNLEANGAGAAALDGDKIKVSLAGILKRLS